MTRHDDKIQDRPGDPSPPPGSLGPGDVLSNRYEIRNLLGQGGMGAVYEVQDRELGIQVALKTLAPHLLTDETALRQLKREVLLARQVSHPNVCRLHDLWRDEDQGLQFCTMELIRGSTLSSRMTDGALDPEAASPIAQQIVAGLQAAHEAGVVHRDLKPGNVMLTDEGRVKLTDFGIARPLRPEEDITATGTERVSGTPAYMAPEQLKGESDGPAADIYALGVLLYEMVTGKLPFTGDDVLGGSLKKLTQEPPSPAVHVTGLPEIWTQTILRCMKKEPQQRFASAELVLAALEGRGDSVERALRSRGKLPAERDPFVGREEDLLALRDRLDGHTRLLSVLGIGGTGKTRLALQLARQHQEDWPGGTWFCDLSEARSREGIVSAVATALDVPLGKEDPVVQLGHAIAALGRCLILFDNFEQVALEAPGTLGHWLDRCEEAQFLVTSRELLSLPGERIFDLAPLSPLDAETLFIQRAEAVKQGFVPSDEDSKAIGELVRLLDLLPLAIEIAAARVVMMTPQKILERADDRFRLLRSAGNRRDRQATLRATLDWSWELLSQDEQSALAQLSVFEGGFTLEAVEQVLELQELWPVDALQSLLHKSLVWSPRGDRFDMLLSVQEYAAEKLQGMEQTEAIEIRHGDYYAGFGTERAIETLNTHGGAELRRRMSLELENLVAACSRAVVRGDGEVAVNALAATWEILELRGPYLTAVELGGYALTLTGMEARLRARCLRLVGRANWKSGQFGAAEEHFEKALKINCEVSNRRAEGIILGDLGVLYWEQGRLEQAREYYRRALAIHREVNNHCFEGIILSNLGVLHHVHGRVEEAKDHYEHALAIHRKMGNRHSEGYVLGNLGVLHFDQGRIQEAREHYEGSLAIDREVGDRGNEGVVRGNLGDLCASQGQIDEAREHFEAALAIHREMGDRRSEGVVLGDLGVLHNRQGQMAEARERFDLALATAREVGNRTSEGFVLGQLGDHYRQQGQLEEARGCLEHGVLLLKDVGDKLELAKLLCGRCRLELEMKDLSAARAAKEEAASLAEETGAGPKSELGKQIAELVELIKEAESDP